MPSRFTRILSDLHYGDRSSRINELTQLAPLLDGPERLVLNGDTLDTRPGPAPAFTRECREAVLSYFPSHVPEVVFLTGNHDADLSSEHSLDLVGGEVFVVHGDICFDNLVPWGRDAEEIERRLAAERARTGVDGDARLEEQLPLIRRVTGAVPQRHQSERHPLKYAWRFLADTVWPPTRILRVLQAWRQAPALAARLTRRHRPQARYVVVGHTHRPGIWRCEAGVTVINTGSFCRMMGGLAVDLHADTVKVRPIQVVAGEFRAGSVTMEFPLAGR